MSERWVLQLCHSYGAPFDDVARQWRALFDNSDCQVLTVFLTGEANDKVAQLVGGEVLFLGYKSKDLKGLKRRQINDIRNLHKQYQFQLAIAHRYKPMYIASHIKDLTVFGVAHAYGVFEGFWRRQFVTRKRDQLMLFGVSQAIRDDVRQALPKFPQGKIQTFYNRINSQALQDGHLDRSAARESLGLPDHAYVIGNVGRLHPDKDQATLLQGFAKALMQMPDAQAKEARLAIIGTGRLEQSLKEQARTLGIADQVVFMGRVMDAWKYFKAFDVFALSSNYEPFGMVLLEAMVAGVPVISSNVGGAPEVVGNTGELFPLGDSERLGQLLAAQPKANSQQASQLLQRVEEHFSDQAAQQAFKRFWN